MNKVVTLLILIVVNFKVFSKDFEYLGVIIDSLNLRPIPNASVILLKNTSPLQQTKTNQNGFFKFYIDSLEFESAKYQLKISWKNKKEEIKKIQKKSQKIDTIFVNFLVYSTSPITITVNKNSNFLEKFHKFEYTIEGKELQKSVSSILGLTLKNETDFFVKSMGPATNKPLFRGLSLDYLKIYENELPVKDLSTTAPDHSTAVDPTIYDKIEIVRGPKLLLYSTNAIGGIINLVSRDFIVEKVQQASLKNQLFYESASKARIYTLVGEIPIYNFFINGGLSFKKAEDILSANGFVPNTYFNSKNGQINFGGYLNNFFALIGISSFNLSYGVPGGFVGAHPKGVDIVQQRNSQALKATNYFHSFVDNISFAFNRTYYHHVEFEKNGSVGAEFLIRNYYSNFNMNFQKMKNVKESTFGITIETSNNNFGGYVFTPNSTSLQYSSYWYQSINFGKQSIEYSLRFDHKEYNPLNEENYKKNPPTNRSFNAFSSSLLLMHQLSEIASVGLNFGRSERIPNAEELYSNGPHLAAYTYEIGNANLTKELSHFIEISLNLLNRNNNLYFSIFDYEFTKFLFPENTGKINVSQLLPIYMISETKARIFGFSTSVSYDLFNNFSTNLSVSFARGLNIKTKKNLPQIPPMKGQINLKYEFKKIQFQISGDFALRQNQVGDFEEPTPGYIIFNFGIYYLFFLNRVVGVVDFSMENIFNKLYFNHLSRIKSIFPEPGRNIKIHLSLYI